MDASLKLDMSNTDFKFHKGDRVRLKFDRAEIYRRAFGGSEAIVQEMRKDEFGYPMIRVEWDKEHWTYNGEQDMWTFEDHFEPVERIVMADKNRDGKLAEDLMNFLRQHMEQGDAPDKEEGHKEEDKAAERERLYNETLSEGLDAATNGEAFMLVTVSREIDPENSEFFQLNPAIFSVYKTDEAGLLLETQLSSIVAAVHQELAGAMIGRIMRERGDDK